METLEVNTEAEAAPERKTYQKECAQCHNPFNSILDRAKFCSNKCRAKYSQIHGLKDNAVKEDKSESPVHEASVSMSLPGLAPQAQYIINHQHSEKTKLEHKVRELEADKKKLQEKCDDLKDQIATIKTDQKIAESAKPSGLDGIMEHPFLLALAPHIGPSVSKLIDKHLVGEGQQMIGFDGQLDGESKEWGNTIIQWYSSMQKEQQKTFAGLIGELMKIPADQLHPTILRMLTLLNTGTTLNSSNTNTLKSKANGTVGSLV